MNNLAEIYRQLGTHNKAEPLYLEAIKIIRKNAGENHPLIPVTMNNLAILKYNLGNYEDAIKICHKALDIHRSNLSENHPDAAKCMNTLAETYRVLGNYNEAESLHKKAKEIHRISFGEMHPEYANSLHNMAVLYRNMGRYDEAEPLFQQALNIIDEDHPSYAISLNGLSGLYKDIGKFVEAEAGYRQAREIMSKAFGESHPNYATALHNLAELYRTMGSIERAKPLCKKALELRREVLNENHPDIATSLIALSIPYYHEYRFSKVLSLLEQALGILRYALGNDHLLVGITIDNLAMVYRTMRKYNEAIALHGQAQNIFSQSCGEDHPDFALNLLNQAVLYHDMGNYSKAKPLYLRTIEIFRTAREEIHQEFAFCLYDLARLMVATNNLPKAFSLVEQAILVDDQIISQIFSISSEQQRMAYIRDLQQNFDIFLSLVYQYFFSSTEAIHVAIDLIIRRKAIGTEVMATQRDAVLGGWYPELKPKIRDLNTIRMQIAQKTLAGPGLEGSTKHQKLLVEWNVYKEDLEAELARKIPEMNLEQKLREVNRHTIVECLSEGVILIEFVRFNLFDFLAVPAKRETRWKSARYIAFVLSSGKPDDVQIVDLGEAENIDKMIVAYRTSITSENDIQEERDSRILSNKVNRMVTQEGKKLRACIFDPLLPAIGSCHQLIFAPAGDLTRLPFEILPIGEDRYLIDDYKISYVSTGRDLLRFETSSKGHPSEPVVIADPDFNLRCQGVSTLKKVIKTLARQSRDLDRSTINFVRLPGTKVEGERIASMLSVKPWLENKALEGQIKALRSPLILHLATHGFFLKNLRFNKERSRLNNLDKYPINRRSRLLTIELENPLLRSGLALAGANTWLKGNPLPEEAEDGILTAEDVLGIDLLMTKLVVLSACETGLGKVITGEGVMGLRRAFTVAGAETLIMSLWKVPDLATAILMERLYDNMIQRGLSRNESLKEAQLYVRNLTLGQIRDKWITPDMINQLSGGKKNVKLKLTELANKSDDFRPFIEPFYWGAFICQGNPALLK